MKTKRGSAKTVTTTTGHTGPFISEKAEYADGFLRTLRDSVASNQLFWTMEAKAARGSGGSTERRAAAAAVVTECALLLKEIDERRGLLKAPTSGSEWRMVWASEPPSGKDAKRVKAMVAKISRAGWNPA